MTGVEKGTGRSPRAGRPSASVLMVLYYFPPIGGVSMARNVANVRHLPAHGWTPVVLGARTAGDFADAQASAYPVGGPGHPSMVSGSRDPGLAVGFVRRVGARRRRSPGAWSDDPSVASAVATARPALETAVPVPAKASSTLGRIRRLLFFPDNQVAWLPFAVATGVRATRLRRFDAVYSTSSPVTAHLIAGVISRLPVCHGSPSSAIHGPATRWPSRCPGYIAGSAPASNAGSCGPPTASCFSVRPRRGHTLDGTVQGARSS